MNRDDRCPTSAASAQRLETGANHSAPTVARVRPQHLLLRPDRRCLHRRPRRRCPRCLSRNRHTHQSSRLWRLRREPSSTRLRTRRPCLEYPIRCPHGRPVQLSNSRRPLQPRSHRHHPTPYPVRRSCRSPHRTFRRRRCQLDRRRSSRAQRPTQPRPRLHPAHAAGGSPSRAACWESVPPLSSASPSSLVATMWPEERTHLKLRSPNWLRR